MAKTGNFQTAELNEACCPTCGAVTNPRWGKCLSCKSLLSAVSEPDQPDTLPDTVAATPLGQVTAKSKIPPSSLAPDDWRSFYEERAAILEHDGGLDRAQADRLAFEAAIAGLSNAMATNHPQDRCSACGTQLAPSMGLPLADKAVVCDGKCHDAHRRQQRERAEQKLAEWGIAAN